MYLCIFLLCLDKVHFTFPNFLLGFRNFKLSLVQLGIQVLYNYKHAKHKEEDNFIIINRCVSYQEEQGLMGEYTSH